MFNYSNHFLPIYERQGHIYNSRNYKVSQKEATRSRHVSQSRSNGFNSVLLLFYYYYYCLVYFVVY